MELVSMLTCPACGSQHTETMEVNACRYWYTCRSCAAILRPRPGDCCVFCSYGDVPCPSKQTGNACCA
jgi:hypothetical protein